MSLPRILCVDDEPRILEALRRTLRSEFDLTTATGGREALDLLASQPPYLVVVSDLRMPEVDGIQVLRSVHERSPETVRVLLTGHADMNAAIQAVNEGQLFRFLTKPCPVEVLRRTLVDAVEQHRLVSAERVLLEETLLGSVRAMAEIVALLHPATVGRANRVSRLVRRMAAHLGLGSEWVFEVAALIAHVGTITLPATVLARLHSGKSLTPQDQEQLAKVPATEAALVASIPRLETVHAVLRDQDQRFDDTGGEHARPHGKDIPEGARLLKIATDFDILETQGLDRAEILECMRVRKGWYDPDYLQALVNVLGQGTEQGTITELKLAEVRIGMTFVEDVRTDGGVLLVARGQQVTRAMMERIHSYWEEYAWTQRVRVAA